MDEVSELFLRNTSYLHSRCSFNIYESLNAVKVNILVFLLYLMVKYQVYLESVYFCQLSFVKLSYIASMKHAPGKAFRHTKTYNNFRKKRRHPFYF